MFGLTKKDGYYSDHYRKYAPAYEQAQAEWERDLDAMSAAHREHGPDSVQHRAAIAKADESGKKAEALRKKLIPTVA
jgi:hypothetical protein